jgi:hypothetical protein
VLPLLADVVVGQLLAFFRCLELGGKPDTPSQGVLTRVVEHFSRSQLEKWAGGRMKRILVVGEINVDLVFKHCHAFARAGPRGARRRLLHDAGQLLDDLCDGAGASGQSRGIPRQARCRQLG